ncbi:expressed unknown protein [Seminavis robusta]|uniref:ARMET C-terminal domain-containing protein n=1 Tax=Seminavis robusta TaxID=568900 RepID=A0A9N8ES38_9STRA|nr:expressed unknown protein [Seminavis robusta]|eukprot:Sro1527_g279910.1 n/a (363) ;mRNA; f:14666-15754
MKFPLVALAALVATTHAFSLQGPVVGHQKLLQNQRERVVLHMDDYDDFDEEDFVDDGDITKPSWGQSASASRMGEVDVIVVEPIETVREATTVVTTDPVSSGEDPSKMRVREIKDELDSWGVDYDDCFEKTDLVKRLEQARENPGQQIGQQIRVEMSAEGRAEKEKLQSFGYVGFTEEEFFAMQSAHARQDPQRGNVVETSVNEAGSNSAGNSQKNVFLEETPEPKQHKKRTTIDSRQGNSVWMEDTPQPTQRKKKSARTIDSRKGNSVWLDDSKPSASQSTAGSGRGVQLEDVPAPKIKNGKRGPRTVEPPQAARGIRVENTPSKFEAPAYTPPPPSRKSTILLEDLPGPDDRGESAQEAQ